MMDIYLAPNPCADAHSFLSFWSSLLWTPPGRAEATWEASVEPTCPREMPAAAAGLGRMLLSMEDVHVTEDCKEFGLFWALPLQQNGFHSSLPDGRPQLREVVVSLPGTIDNTNKNR